MSYIKTEEVIVNKLTCSHPKVSKIWEYGALSEVLPLGTDMMYRCVCILLKSEDPTKAERYEWKDNGDGSAIIEAEKFLETL